MDQQSRRLLFRDEMSRYIRLFAWEIAYPSKIFLKFMATNTGSYLTTVVVSRADPYLLTHRNGPSNAWPFGRSATAAFSCGTANYSRTSRSALRPTSDSWTNEPSSSHD